MSSMPSPAAPRESRATTVLVLGLLSFLCCQICAPIAWFLGQRELEAIAAGEAPAAGEANARVGMILGIVGTCLLALTMVWLGTAGFAVVMGALSRAGRWP